MMNNFLRKDVIHSHTLLDLSSRSGEKVGGMGDCQLKALLLILFLLFFGLWDVGQAHSVVLLTPEEAAMPEVASTLPAHGEARRFEQRFIVPESAVEGPEIQVLSPEPEKAYPSPLKVLVKFVPREGTRIELSSLKVECLKILTINITDRIREYISNQGINMDKAELPRGTHKIRVTLGDTGGGVTSKVFVVKVQ